MRKILLALLLFPLLALTPPNRSLDSLRLSVGHLLTPLDKGMVNFCSATSIGVGKWLTEAHCEMNEESTLNGEKVVVLRVDKGSDLMTVSGPIAPIVPISRREPELGEAVTMMGWPHTWAHEMPLMFFGRMQLENQTMGIEDWPAHQVNMFHEGGGPGMSGGPIFDAAGELIGVIEAEGQYPSVSIVSPTVKVIRKFLGLKS